jgi:hypothetical protein
MEITCSCPRDIFGNDIFTSTSNNGGGKRLLGTWDASTNTPTLPIPPSETYQQGDYYDVSVAGTFNDIDFTVGDKIVVVYDVNTSSLKWVQDNFGQEAVQISYANTESGLIATNIQDAIDEVVDSLPITQLNVNTRYVSPVGNDTLIGEVKAKKQTISNAITSLDGQSSGIVFAESGTYAEDLVFGTAQSGRAIIGDRDRVILKSITFNENCQQCKISNVKFENTAGGVAINVQSTLSGFVFDGLNIGGNHDNPVFLNVEAGGSGFITISNCDLSDKIINLEATATPRFVFISNCANALINAGTGWFVVIDYNSQKLLEVSSNNNVIRGVIANALLNNSTEYNAVVSQGALANGFYLVNYTEAGVFQTGDIILIQHPVTAVYNLHYNTPLANYYVLSTQKTFHKNGGLWLETASKDDIPTTTEVVYDGTQDQVVTITHNKNKYPMVSFIAGDGDNTGKVSSLNVTHNSKNAFSVDFGTYPPIGTLIYL